MVAKAYESVNLVLQLADQPRRAASGDGSAHRKPLAPPSHLLSSNVLNASRYSFPPSPCLCAMSCARIHWRGWCYREQARTYWPGASFFGAGVAAAPSVAIEGASASNATKLIVGAYIHTRAEFLFETRMASQSDEAALLALMADSAARVAEATRANTALVEQHELAAATFSSRATAEISRLQGEARR